MKLGEPTSSARCRQAASLARQWPLALSRIRPWSTRPREHHPFHYIYCLYREEGTRHSLCRISNDLLLVGACRGTRRSRRPLCHTYSCLELGSASYADQTFNAPERQKHSISSSFGPPTPRILEPSCSYQRQQCASTTSRPPSPPSFSSLQPSQPPSTSPA